jgi:hypothetical protein
MLKTTNLSTVLIIILLFILSSCSHLSETKENDSVQHSESEVKDSSKSSKSKVPPLFGETPRYRGGLNPINPAGPGGSAY